ncbi:hypothetical protein O181_047520 [Austropuccinia psidii MF-1]|uniref:Uncharacterized protein n=1 Tax=Austropuccinia psidii MF-1 TaxID=1389203 RepID=A0A9Q3HN92_9BASI|nr:hypothetical protein [Austropuccinia psidii MF-1]
MCDWPASYTKNALVCIAACSTEAYINELEDIVKRTKMGRTWEEFDIEIPKKPFMRKEKPKGPFSNTHAQRICYKFSIGHTANNCLKKAKINKFVAFETDKEPLGAINGDKVDIILNVEKTNPPLLRRPAHPPSPRPRKALVVHIKELRYLGILRKVGHNQKVEVTTSVIVACNNCT